jgi:hypothetical protein
MSTVDLYETYIRTAEGDTYHPTDIRKGIAQFLSGDGYRISFNIDGVVITLRKDTLVDADMRFLDEKLGSESVDCAVTIRGHIATL